ncbi:MAG: HAD family hydrolase [Burkholderiales bacterium]|nr:HAD family hydrolase [Burkholderiales bacterium]
MTRRALFVGKDGTLVEDIPYNVDPAQLRFTPGAVQALQHLHAFGFALFVVSNQTGVALGRFDERALLGVERALRERLAVAGVALAGMYWCPHHPQGTAPRYALHCDCRKPLPGLLWRAAREHGLDLATSWMLGDILDDVEAGRRAGCRTVLLDNGHETQWQITPLRLPHLLASDTRCAADAILAVESMAASATLPAA